MLAPMAVQLRTEGSFMFPSVLVAQGILETGCEVNGWNNLLGIKGTSAHSITPFWDGTIINKQTREVINGIDSPNIIAGFRVYKSIENCMRDHALLINKSSIYDQTRAAKTATDQCVALYRDGYATDATEEVDGDPAYYEKLISIIKSNGLEVYDKKAEQQKEALEVAKIPEGLDQGAGLTILRTWLKKSYEAAEDVGNREDMANIKWLGQQLRLAFHLPPDAD